MKRATPGRLERERSRSESLDVYTFEFVQSLAGMRRINVGPSEFAAKFGVPLPGDFGTRTWAFLSEVFMELSEQAPPINGEFAKPLDAVPTYLGLAEKNRMRAAALLLDVLCKYSPKSWWEFLWCLAVDATRPKKRGRRPRWVGGPEGTRLLYDVYFLSQRMALDPARKKELAGKKGLDRVIAALQKEKPERYGKIKGLRRAYYDARKYGERVRKAVENQGYSAQSGNSTNKRT